MVVGLLGNESPDSNRLTLVTPKSENDVRLQATLGNQNPSGLPVGAVRELPQYHLPTFSYVLRSMWERGWSFIKKAGTIILISAIILWFLQAFGFEDGSFTMVEDLNNSILAIIGNLIAWIFSPLGWGNWEAVSVRLNQPFK